MVNDICLQAADLSGAGAHVYQVDFDIGHLVFEPPIMVNYNQIFNQLGCLFITLPWAYDYLMPLMMGVACAN